MCDYAKFTFICACPGSEEQKLLSYCHCSRVDVVGNHECYGVPVIREEWMSSQPCKRCIARMAAAAEAARAAQDAQNQGQQAQGGQN